MSKRAGFEKIILKEVWNLTRSKENVAFYEEKFKGMNDKEFHQFALDLKAKKVRISIVTPNFSEIPSTEEIMAVAEKYGHQFEERLVVQGMEGKPDYITPVKYLILMVPVRRASQLLTKKISVPPHTKVRDTLTGQVTGESKGTKVSGPEVQILAGMGAFDSAVEMMKFRGGDLRGEAALIAMLSRFGQASQAVLENYSSGVQVTTALRTYLTAAMHRTNL